MEDKRYNRGKIYRIVDIGYNKCYIGSTIEDLKQRMAKHRDKYKQYKQGKYGKTMSFDLFDEYGVENCKIELIEMFSCNSKMELEAREGYYIKNEECVNKCIVGRTEKQWREDNKDRLKQYKEDNRDRILAIKKKHRETHKEEIAVKMKEWREKNKEEIKDYNKQYRLNNIEKIKNYSYPDIQCVCGVIVGYNHKATHLKSKHHQAYLLTLENEE